MGRTKIVATIGPASRDPEVMKNMIEAGLDAVRLNLSHGTLEEHLEVIELSKQLSNSMKASLATIVDTKGPEIRGIPAWSDTMAATRGEKVLLIPKSRESEVQGSPALVIDWPPLHRHVQKGTRVLLGDGELELKVRDVKEGIIHCEAQNEGQITGRKAVTIPNIDLSQPTLTEQDKKNLERIIPKGIDWISLSFVKDAQDIQKARELVEECHQDGDQPLLIAKIETAQAVENIDEIVCEADGLMVARGDLGMSTDLDELPFTQKKIISLANSSAKPVITATQMLESMIKAPSPTRAEVTDVANAVLDGTDALMLSAETATGAHPVETVRTMYRISTKAETHEMGVKIPNEELEKIAGIAPAIGRSACEVAKGLDAKAIITSTRSGYTARLISRFRPHVRIVAVTPSSTVFHQLSLVWGVHPLRIQVAGNTDQMIERSIEKTRKEGLIVKGDLVVVTAGIPFAEKGTTNLIKVERV
ncbi:MAG: pyruvate kinase [Candidatus Bipolaricaulota bacterium]